MYRVYITLRLSVYIFIIILFSIEMSVQHLLLLSTTSSSRPSSDWWSIRFRIESKISFSGSEFRSQVCKAWTPSSRRNWTKREKHLWKPSVGCKSWTRSTIFGEEGTLKKPFWKGRILKLIFLISFNRMINHFLKLLIYLKNKWTKKRNICWHKVPLGTYS